jgi:hypothetical protein
LTQFAPVEVVENKNPEELQLYHNHENFLFLTVLLLCTQRIIYYW